ncbi:hypothetical protein FISHEDRAFT_53353 [Fistulina hepatica ATCC 64428]|nr:hypothetical protein FISHEDRAFT_53353 [Fistulina hepatica ATCC 64428]
MDSHAFGSLAQLQILLIPVGLIPQSSFESYAAEIRTFEEIRHVDIPESGKDDRDRFMPRVMSGGQINISFPSHAPPFAHTPLSLLRPSHFPLAVLGVASCSQSDLLSDIRDHFHATIMEMFPPGSIYPLARTCFVFEETDESTSLDQGEDLGLVVIPSMMGDKKKVYIGTQLGELCSRILGEFGVLFEALESPQGNEYLNSATLPTLPPLSEIPVPLDKDMQSGFVKSSLPSVAPFTSQPEVNRSSHSATPPLKRNNTTTSIRTSVGTKAKKRQATLGVASSPARLCKALGDFFLLAGRIVDADIWYTEALSSLKPTTDPVWYASALEGAVTVAIMDAWVTGHGLISPVSPTSPREPWADIMDKLSQAIALYGKQPPSEDADCYSLMSYLYCSAVLRQTHLLFSIWSSKGWGPLAFTAMLHPGPSPYLPPTLSHLDENTPEHLERLSLASGVSRAQISSTLSQVHGPWLLHLDPRERISILEATASIYACIRFRRKEVYILREILGCILDLVVCGREEGVTPFSRERNTSTSGLLGLGIKVPNSAASTDRGDVGIRPIESQDGNTGVLRVLSYVCSILGIQFDAVKVLDGQPAGPKLDRRNSTPPVSLDDDQITAIEPSGWPELQIGVVREAVAVAETLPDYPSVAQFSLSSLKTLQHVLEPGDQYYLHMKAARALATARRRGDMRVVEYWSGRPVVSITISPLPLARLPLEKPMSALRPASDVTPILTGGTDPFLYNPRRAAGQGQTLVVKNETLEFVLVLQNPYVFDLELQSLSLCTSGVQFETKPIQTIIPAGSLHRVTLSGKTTAAGILTIRGCIAQALGTMPREFLLPLSTPDEETRISRKRAAAACETGRSKYSGLLSFPAERHKRAAKKPERTSQSVPTKYLEVRVVPEQPLLRIRRTSVTHGAVMLYENEKSTIRITVENVSHLPVDFVRLSFDDSTLAPAQQALAEGNLSVFDTYETEFSLIHRPLFSWSVDAKNQYIAPGQKLSLTINALGKSGCNESTIYISYSYAHRPLAEGEAPAEVFHTRQLSYPVMVTVYQMLECTGMDIMPFPLHTPKLQDGVASQDKARRLNMNTGDKDGWCLFSIEVRNMYGQPFDVSFDRTQEGVLPASSKTTIPPGSTTRVILPIKRFLLSEEQVSLPIPTLSDRQFVVNKSALSDEQERVQRELFWYREELFKCVHGHWQETGGVRSGELSLRRQRMTMPLLMALRTEAARIRMTLIRYNSDEDDDTSTIEQRAGKYFPPANEFVYLRCAVKNMTPSPITCSLDLALSPSEHLIYDGVLSDIMVGELRPDETREVDTALCFLANGGFEISASVRVKGSLEPSLCHLVASVGVNS